MGDTPRIRLPRAGERFARVILKYLATPLARPRQIVELYAVTVPPLRPSPSNGPTSRRGLNFPLRRERFYNYAS